MGRWWQGQEEVDGLRLHFGGRNNRTSGRLDVKGEGRTRMMCDSSLQTFTRGLVQCSPDTKHLEEGLPAQV